MKKAHILLTQMHLKNRLDRKEGFASIFAVKKCHRMIFGRRFTLQTHHKPDEEYVIASGNFEADLVQLDLLRLVECHDNGSIQMEKNNSSIGMVRLTLV